VKRKREQDNKLEQAVHTAPAQHDAIHAAAISQQPAKHCMMSNSIGDTQFKTMRNVHNCSLHTARHICIDLQKQGQQALPWHQLTMHGSS